MPMAVTRYVLLFFVLHFSVQGSPSTTNTDQNIHGKISSAAPSQFSQLEQTWQNLDNNNNVNARSDPVNRVGRTRKEPPGQGYEAVSDQSGFDRWVGGDQDNSDAPQPDDSKPYSSQEDRHELRNGHDEKLGDVFQDDDKNQIERKIQLGRNMEETDAALVSKMASSETVRLTQHCICNITRPRMPRCR